jgi:ComF family protein
MFRSWARSIVDLVYPRRCPACKRSSRGVAYLAFDICRDCWQSIAFNTPPFCAACGRHLRETSPDVLCEKCRLSRPEFDRAFSPCVYDGTLKKLIHEFKYGGKDYLWQPLCSLLLDFIRDYRLPMGEIDGIVPVPLYPGRLREREFNQAELLAAGISRAHAIPLLAKALARTKQTARQTDLPPAGRRENVRGAFRVHEPAAVRGKRLLIVDDVLTTGSTAGAVSRALKEAGSAYCLVLTIAS